MASRPDTSHPTDGQRAWNDALEGTQREAFEIVVSIRRLNLIATRDVSTRVSRLGLSDGDVDILAHLFEAGPPYSVVPSQLAQMCMVTTGAITGRVNRLEKAGLVERTPSDIDGRSSSVTATQSGLAFAGELARSLTESRLHRVLRGLDENALAGLVHILRDIRRQLDD